MIRFLKPLIIIVLLLFTTTAFGAEDFDPLASGFRMMWGLGIVIAILFVISLVLKKNLKTLNKQDKGNIKILEVKHVMPKKSLMLIEIRGQQYLAGGGSDSIDTIIPLQKEVSFTEVLANSEEATSQWDSKNIISS